MVMKQRGAPLEIMDWPSGIETAGGGTRAEVKVNRPWEAFLPAGPEGCPFCLDGSREPSLYEVDADWKVLANSSTPFAFHRLIIPISCWPLEMLQTLGGVEPIYRVLRIAATIMSLEQRSTVRLGVHIGSLAGQNICHLHYHLLEPIRLPSVPEVGAQLLRNQDPELYISKSDAFTVSAGGVRAGQLLIVPNDGALPPTDGNLHALAETLAETIVLGARKFLSVQGAPPEFMIGMSFVEGQFDWGYYLPILNHMGFTEYFGLMEGTPMILPWPHAKTAAFLKS